MARFFSFFLLTLLFFIVGTQFAHATSLYRNLKLGNRGEDVRLLQVVLNKDPETIVALFGPGSLGDETSYFGLLTDAAVKKFQKKYSKEILLPLGLNFPTGIVGLATKKVITRLSKESTAASATSSLVSTNKEISVSAKDITTQSVLIDLPFNSSISEKEFDAIASSFNGKTGQVLGVSTGRPFGGKILETFPCDNGILITIGPPVPGIFMFIPGASTLFEYYQIRPGPWSLGLATLAPSACIIAGPNIPAEGTIFIIGTSL